MAVGKTIRTKIFARDNGQCVFCGTIHNLTIDHKIPLSKGGANNEDNLQTLCKDCNHAKGNKMNYDPKNPPFTKRKRRMLGVVESHVSSTGTIAHSAPKLKKPVVIGKVELPSKPKRSAQYIEVKAPVKIPFATWIGKLQKKYPHAYSLVPEFMWIWIYDNLIIKEL